MAFNSTHNQLTQFLDEACAAPRNAADEGASETIDPEQRGRRDGLSRDKVIYLSSDADEELDEIEWSPDCAYIIGGIVDRNRLKGEAFRKVSLHLGDRYHTTT